ncbi:hypothetical protein LSH36_207g00049 [Paralvinella palmiformis]|uniref:glutathione transferase n=1 Tax=Paralvinella palmiformis TaxID=53620 RepID=A0AAD9JP74_9ANNE|nr:hypothetical protein LSH36_207g00049 [Paralvinella palmiformis]
MDSMCYGPQFEALLPQFIKDLPTKLKLFEAFLGDRVWLAGDKMTFVDFVMYELMDQHKVLLPDCLSGYPKLQAFQKRFENLPAIKAYMNSDKFIKGPVYNKMASFKK